MTRSSRFQTIFTTHSSHGMGLIRGTELKESNVIMENREMPILHELTGLRPR